MSTESLNSDLGDYAVVTCVQDLDLVKETCERRMSVASSQEVISNSVKQQSIRTKDKMSLRDYVRENSVNEDRENEFKNKMADQSCHVQDPGDILASNKYTISERPEPFNDEDCIGRKSEETTHLLQTDLPHVTLPAGTDVEMTIYTPAEHSSLDTGENMNRAVTYTRSPSTHECRVDMPDHIGSGETLSSTDEVSQTKCLTKKFKCWLAACSIWNAFLMLIVLMLVLLFVFKVRHFGQETSQPGNMTILNIGFPESNMSVYGVFSINETALKDKEEIRYINRYNSLPSNGLYPSLTSPCISVEISGLYKIESQVSFSFGHRVSSATFAKHVIEVKNDVTDKDETVAKRQISAPEDILTSGRPHRETSNIAQLTPVSAGDKICIVTTPTKNVYNKMVANVLNIELRIKLEPGSYDGEYHQ